MICKAACGLNTMWLGISSGNGPEECAHAAALTLQVLQKEIEERQEADISARLIEAEPSRINGNIRSALLVLDGENVKTFTDTWTGVIQWIWRSEYRPHHKRKNWFVQVKPYIEPAKGNVFSLADARFETARASGPDGQYVNKTESAVRAVHVPTGKSVLAREERSQLLNKRLALARLASLFDDEQANTERQSRSVLRHTHWELERGNPIRVYDGETLKLLRRNNG
jgi:peptide chain release factor